MPQSEYVKARVNFMLSQEARELLEELAATLGLSMSSAVELAIRKLWAAEGAPLAQKLKRRRGRTR